MLPLSDGLHPRRFPIVNVALIAANFVTRALLVHGQVMPQCIPRRSALAPG